MANDKSFPEQIADLVFAQLLAVRPGVVTAFGRREQEKNAGAGRVVAVPLGSELREATRPGDAGYTAVKRILYIRRFDIEWHCHGYRDSDDTGDFAQAEALYLDTLRSVRHVTHAAVEFRDERWLDQQEGADSFERFGSVISFTSTIDIPLYEIRDGGIITLTATPPIDTTVTINGQEG